MGDSCAMRGRVFAGAMDLTPRGDGLRENGERGIGGAVQKLLRHDGLGMAYRWLRPRTASTIRPTIASNTGLGVAKFSRANPA